MLFLATSIVGMPLDKDAGSLHSETYLSALKEPPIAQAHASWGAVPEGAMSWTRLIFSWLGGQW